jgi:hypothetical protein
MKMACGQAQGQAWALAVGPLEQATLMHETLQSVPTRAIKSAQWSTDFTNPVQPGLVRVARLFHISTDHNIELTTVLRRIQ